MERRVCLHLWLALAGLLAFAQAQAPAFSDPAAPPFLVRLQRTTSDHQVCALVRGDGLFHLERETSNRYEVLEGLLKDQELTDLKSALGDHQLAGLTQQKIAVPLVITERDVLRISILRSPFTQNLAFGDRESRRPFDDFISPLVHLIDILQKHPHKALDEFGGRNNCMPPRKTQFSMRQPEPPSAETVPSSRPGDAGSPASRTSLPVPPQNLFLMRWQLNHIAEGTVEDTCIIVYPAGPYRMEKSTQHYGDKLKVHTFEDSLSDAELQQLRELLDQPTLKASTHENFPAGKVFREGEITTLAVPRGGRIQQLSFASYFAVPGWVSNVSATTDREEKLVAPLRKWLKAHIETRKTPLADSAPTHCASQPQGANP